MFKNIGLRTKETLSGSPFNDNLTVAFLKTICGRVAQLVEQTALNRKVQGSIPCSSTRSMKFRFCGVTCPLRSHTYWCTLSSSHRAVSCRIEISCFWWVDWIYFTSRCGYFCKHDLLWSLIAKIPWFGVKSSMP